MPNKACYVEGVFDLFHIGHLRIIKRSKEIFGTVVVGVHSDETVLSYKGRKPVIPYLHRVEIVESCKFVDKVIEAPLLRNYDDGGINFLDNKGLDYLVHGRCDRSFLEREYASLLSCNKVFLIDETPDYHTTDLRKKCQIKQ